MHQTISVQEVVKLNNVIIIDVRSESEFAHAHIPGAISIPIFNDKERKIIGTAYKHESREKAIKIGLKYFGSKMVELVNTLEAKHSKEVSKTVYVHCARGGMRSATMAWLFSLYGWSVYQVEGGYKSYRNWVLGMFSKDYPLLVIGGATGTGKTKILHEMVAQDLSIIDLEDLAQHKGSAFGGLHAIAETNQEQFENNLANALQQQAHHEKIYIEDESKRIGQISVPNDFWDMMRSKKIIYVNISFEKRLEHIYEEYGRIPTKDLINATIRIQKNLGGLATKQIIDLFEQEEIKNGFEILLRYYDKYYQKGLEKRTNWAELMHKINGEVTMPDLIKNIKSISE
jgi:tRNA 2-selenouridine synthase